MATIKFQLQSKSDNAPIYLRLSLDRNTSIKRKTGLSINPKEWSNATGLPKQNSPTSKNLNSDLNNLKAKIYDNLNDALANGVTITGDWLQNRIDIHFERINEHNQSELVIDAVQSILDTAEVRKNARGGVGLSKSRINSYKSLKRTFENYELGKNLKVKDVNVNFATQFLKYMLHTKKFSKSHALKKMSDLKTVCYDAELDGIETHPQLKKIQSGKVKNENIIYLTPSELEKIKNANIVGTAHQNARKWLLLGCNIGQRGGDLLEINDDNFITRNGYEVIELTQQKTGKDVTIPVLDTTKEILKDGLPYKISLPKLNKYIKEVCALAEIDQLIKGSIFDKETKRKKKGEFPKCKLITTHVCRRSFATNNYGIIPTTLLMQITAHSTERMFLSYIGKNSLDYAQQIADFYTLQAQKAKKEPQLSIVKKFS